jgi:hypothetical protein
MISGDFFAPIHLAHAFLEPLVEGGLADLEPLLLSLKKIEGLGNDIGWEP